VAQGRSVGLAPKPIRGRWVRDDGYVPLRNAAWFVRSARSVGCDYQEAVAKLCLAVRLLFEAVRGTGMSVEPDLAREMVESMGELEACVDALSRCFPPPRFGRLQNRHVFRYAEHDDVLLSMLKCVRAVTSLNAALVLLRAGYVHEVYALCRIVDEANEDVWFMAAPGGKDGEATKDQQRFFEEFFQEEFSDEVGLLKSQQPRDRVSRQKIRAGIAKWMGQAGNPSDAIAIDRTLYQAFSGYVHGAYVHIMDSYGGVPPGHFHMHGMMGTPRIGECGDQLKHYVFRAICAAEIVAVRLQDDAIRERLRRLRESFGAKTGCLTKDRKVLDKTLKRMKTGKS